MRFSPLAGPDVVVSGWELVQFAAFGRVGKNFGETLAGSGG